MNKKALHIIGICMAFCATAEVQPIILKLSASGSQNSYTVPTGSVLIIEHVLSTTGGARFRLERGTPTMSLAYVDFPGADGFHSLTQPMKIPENFHLTFPESGTDVVIFGLLVSKQDLYASIESALENATTANGYLTGDLHVSSPRPVDIVFEKSQSLTNWSRATEVELLPTADKRHLQFAAKLNDQKQFYKARVRAR